MESTWRPFDRRRSTNATRAVQAWEILDLKIKWMRMGAKSIAVVGIALPGHISLIWDTKPRIITRLTVSISWLPRHKIVTWIAVIKKNHISHKYLTYFPETSLACFYFFYFHLALAKWRHIHALLLQRDKYPHVRLAVKWLSVRHATWQTRLKNSHISAQNRPPTSFSPLQKFSCLDKLSNTQHFRLKCKRSAKLKQKW